MIRKILVLQCLLFAIIMQPVLSMGGSNHPLPVDSATKAKINKWMKNHGGLSFLENKGQMPDMQGNQVKGLLFKASADGVDMYVTTSGLSYVFTRKEMLKSKKLNSPGESQDSLSGQYCRADMELVGANIRKENIVKEDESETYNNYYLGNCPDGILNVHSYRRITIKNIYPGIDWVLYTAAGAPENALNKAGLQYDFIVHPGADPSVIKLRYKWTDKPQMQNDGSLKIHIPLGNITEGSPVTYQPATASYKLSANIHTAYTLNNNEVGFALANYDKSKTLVIDPPLYWSTYYGGSGTDVGNSIYSDGTDVWVTGSTTSTNFPVSNPNAYIYYQGTLTTATRNAFVAEFNAATGIRVWVTYYGGTTSGESDEGTGISGDANNIWVVGQSNADGVTFPTANPNNYTWYQSWTGVTNSTGLTAQSVPSGTIQNNSPGFVLEFNKSNGTRLYATFLSGTSGPYNDGLSSVWDDGTDVWVCGAETSADFPVLYKPGYYHLANFSLDGAAPTLAEFSATSGALLWCTQIGDGATASDNALSVCSDGTYVWLTGCEGSGGLATATGAGSGVDLAGSFYESTNTSVTDGYPCAYIARITISTHTPSWVTYYGGNAASSQNYAGGWTRTGYGDAIYSDGTNVWFTGTTGSSNLASTAPVALDNPGGGAYYQSTNSVSGTVTGFHAFIAEFSVAGVLKWGTYYGGSGTSSTNGSEADKGEGIQKDNNGNVWFTGETQSTNFPTLNPGCAYYQSSLGGTQNAFVLQFNTSDVRQWATYFGGSGTDEGNSIYSDGTNLWMTGGTTSGNFPLMTWGGAYNQAANAGGEDAFVVDFAGLQLDVSNTNLLCNGNNTGTAQVTACGGTTPYTYSWNPGGQSNALATGLSAGTYTVTVTDNIGHSSSATVTITQPASLTGTISGTGETCNGSNNATATVNPSGGTSPYTYSWNPSGQSNATATGLSAGTYTVTIEDNNDCSTSLSVTITQPPAIRDSISSSVNPSCNGATGNATVGVKGGTSPYIYSWNPGGQTNATATGLSAGFYTVTITDANGCTGSATVTITQPNILTATMGVPVDPACGGGTGSAIVTAGGGTPNYSYLWAPSGGTNANGTGLTAGSYTVIVTDAGGCTASATVTITQPTTVTATIGATSNVSCNGGSNGSATVNAGGGTSPYTYSWNPSGQSNPTATGLSAGTYTVTVKDNHGCSATTSVTITQPPAIRDSISSSVNPSCNGGTGSATVGVKGGTSPYVYSWNPSGQTNATATGLSAGSYTVNITDANGCTASATVTITQPIAISATIGAISYVSCNGGNNGSATVNIAGGTGPYIYLWTPSGGTTNTGTGLTAGSYTVNVTDANGCIASATLTITQPTTLTATMGATSNVSCNGGSNGSATVNAGGGTSPYTYSWNPSGQSNATATGLSAGTYTVTVKDNHGCLQTAIVNITQPAPVSGIASGTGELCNGGNNATATVNPSGGTPPYVYSWNPSGQTNVTATGLSAGTYVVTITDVNGCHSSANVTITQPVALLVTTAPTNVLCNGGNSGSAEADVAGGTTPYTYSWNPSGQTTPTATGLSAGTYTVTVKDNNGCSQTAAVTINQPAPITLVASATSVSCNGTGLGNATVNPSGGNPPYAYSWSPGGQATPTATGLSLGTYTVTVTDANGCTNSTTAAIAQSTPLVVSFSPDIRQGCSPLCIQFRNTTTINSGDIISYFWTFGNGDTSYAENPLYCYAASGSYNVSLTVTLYNGCSATLNVINMITVFTRPDAAFTSSPQPATILAPTIQFSDQSTAQYPINQWLWTFGDRTDSVSTRQNPVHTYQDTGTYCARLVVTDEHGCTDTATNCLDIEPAFNLYIPSAFTPNGDGLNDVFMAKGEYVKSFEMYIFDRWGTEIFHSNNINEGWNGTAKGGSTICQEDTYIYKILATDYANNQHSYIGNVTLLK